MCGPLTSLIKCCFKFPGKNKVLAANEDIQNLITLIGEQLLPEWCAKKI